jgi:hypothetical protein
MYCVKKTLFWQDALHATRRTSFLYSCKSLTHYINFRKYLRSFRAGVVRSVQCLTTDWTTGRSRFDFSSSLCVQNGSGAHSASCPLGTGGPSPGGKARPRRDADHSLHPVPRSWMSRSYTSSPPSASIACSDAALAFNLWSFSSQPYCTCLLSKTYFNCFQFGVKLGLFAKRQQGDQIKMDEMGGACNMYGINYEGQSINKVNYIFHRRMYPLCTHELSTALLHVWTCSTRDFLIKLAILSLTGSCQNGCVDTILKFTLFTDSPSYKTWRESNTKNIWA